LHPLQVRPNLNPLALNRNRCHHYHANLNASTLQSLTMSS
jgi:hypothetical protein